MIAHVDPNPVAASARSAGAGDGVAAQGFQQGLVGVGDRVDVGQVCGFAQQGAGCGGRVHQQRIQRHPAHAQSRCRELRRLHGSIDAYVLVDQCEAVQWDGTGGQDRLEDAEVVEGTDIPAYTTSKALSAGCAPTPQRNTRPGASASTSSCPA
jgi:hypothetical protein